MKILHIASAYDLISKTSGGRGQVIYELARKQIYNGHKVYVAAFSCNIDGYITSSSVKTVSLRYNYIINWLIRRIIETWHHYKSFKKFGSSVDIIHCHITEEGTGLSFLAKKPCIVTLHGAPTTKVMPYIITKIYSISSKAKAVACSKSGYLSQKRIYGDKIIGYVYNGLDVRRFPFILKPQKKHDIELCFAGRIMKIKGVHIAIKVADKLHNDGYDVHLKIHGLIYPGHLTYLKNILQMAKERRYVDIELNVSKTKLYNSLGNSDAVLFPSIFDEPFGYVMIESMACGTPVVAFSVGSVPEIIENGVNGYICNNIYEMVNAIYNVHKINRKICRRIVEEKFSADAMYEKYMQIYQMVLEK